MKVIQVIVFAQFLFSAAMLNAQTEKPQKPVKTGNEWKMPGDVVQRSRTFDTK